MCSRLWQTSQSRLYRRKERNQGQSQNQCKMLKPTL